MSNIVNDKKSLIDQIKENPVKLFIWVFPYILVIGLGIGLFYISRLNQVERQTVPPALPDSTAEVSDLQLEMPKTTPMADVMELSKPSDALVQEGKTLFSTNCASCHGANGKGDGMAAAALNPKPRNFTSKNGWINGPKISGIFKTLSEGVSGSAMVAFDALTPKQKFALAQYIRSTFVPNPPEDSKEELTDLAQTYKLNEEQKSPGQIPIADAMVLVMRENQPKYQKVLSAISMIEKDAGSSNGAKIFETVTNDKVKALTSLVNTEEWRNNEKAFVDLVANEISENGFNYKIHDLKNEQWDALYSYVSSVL